jgi:hypothetical protein
MFLISSTTFVLRIPEAIYHKGRHYGNSPEYSRIVNITSTTSNAVHPSTINAMIANVFCIIPMTIGLL